MDSKQFEKIEGGFIQAVELMRSGYILIGPLEREYAIQPNEILYYFESGKWIPSNMNYNDCVRADWKKPKTFGVREAMCEHPGEWVGTFADEKFEIYKVGLDLKNFRAVKAPVGWIGPCDLNYVPVRKVNADELDLCKPIIKVTK